MTQVAPLYVVTHAELTAGYQIAQVAHAVADFALHRTAQFRHWHKNSQHIVALQCKDADKLQQLFQQAQNQGHDIVAFNEPDLNNEITSIAFSPDNKNRGFLAHLPLAGRRSGNQNKHFQKNFDIEEKSAQ